MPRVQAKRRRRRQRLEERFERIRIVALGLRLRDVPHNHLISLLVLLLDVVFAIFARRRTCQVFFTRRCSRRAHARIRRLHRTRRTRLRRVLHRRAALAHHHYVRLEFARARAHPLVHSRLCGRHWGRRSVWARGSRGGIVAGRGCGCGCALVRVVGVGRAESVESDGNG